MANVQPDIDEVDPLIAPHKVQECTDWADFKRRIEMLDVEFGQSERRITRSTRIVYRGLPRTTYDLLTTLERLAEEVPDESKQWTALDIRDYFTSALLAKSAIESHTGRTRPYEAPEWLKKHAEVPDLTELFDAEATSFMIYLRHHGFPSPLLDWTESPYVAAFFAFREQQPEQYERVAIHVYKDMHSAARMLAPRGMLTILIPNEITTDPRHHLQQARYTVCASTSSTRFVSLDKALGTLAERSFPRRYGGDGEADSFVQDIRWLFTIPASERRTALRDLDRMNVTAYSLFGDEDSLMASLANRQYLLLRE